MAKKKHAWCFYSINFQTGKGVITGSNEDLVRRQAEDLGVTYGQLVKERTEFVYHVSGVKDEDGSGKT